MDKETDREEGRQTNPHTDRWMDRHAQTDTPMDGFMVPNGNNCLSNFLPLQTIFMLNFFCHVKIALCVTVYFQPFQIEKPRPTSKEHQSEDKINTEHAKNRISYKLV